MSLRMDLGRGGSLLLEEPGDAHFLSLEHPVLLEDDVAAIRAAAEFRPVVLDATWDAASGAEGLVAALDALAARAEEAVRAGAEILVITDKGMSRERAAIPALLALGAVREHLLRAGLRYRVGLVVEAGDARDVHHLAVLHGFGAEAVHPWLALASVRALAAKDGLEGDAAAAFRASAEKGLRKVLAKMGISALSSYCGGQVYDALGLAPEVMEKCFRGTASPLGGLGFAEIAEDALAAHRAAFGRARRCRTTAACATARTPRSTRGRRPSSSRSRRRRRARRRRGRTSATKADARAPSVPRDLIGFAPAAPVGVEEVESASEIAKRFIVSAMSLGALSPEAHETLAIAMNRLGARSNSGEGGEDPATWTGSGAERRDNKIKQVASARFGVTAEYLVRADELEIKVAQGAKPGEGGQLPAHKNSPLIARLRHAVPGIALISPPPHHDIYSIEDLAQLIHDLKEVNPKARVGVKLVSEAGVGRVAAGVAKAFADYVLIAGHSGGTGASPLSSIKHAGSPWELGLAETQQALVENGLRRRIEVRVDGGLRTAKDVVIAACLGAEAFGFGTAPLVAAGCAMARQCHLNTCPTGVATQREDLRKKFRGTPEMVMAYFLHLAEDVRELLASLGARTIDEIVGPRGPPRARRAPRVAAVARSSTSRCSSSGRATRRPRAGGCSSATTGRARGRSSRRSTASSRRTSRSASGRAARTPGRSRCATTTSRSARTSRASSSGRSGRLPPGAVRLKFRGPAGQSFGAFAIRGLTLELEGEANDGVGKGLSGAEIVIRPVPARGLHRACAGAGAARQRRALRRDGGAPLRGGPGGRPLRRAQLGRRRRRRGRRRARLRVHDGRDGRRPREDGRELRRRDDERPRVRPRRGRALCDALQHGARHGRRALARGRRDARAAPRRARRADGQRDRAGDPVRLAGRPLGVPARDAEGGAGARAAGAAPRRGRGRKRNRPWPARRRVLGVRALALVLRSRAVPAAARGEDIREPSEGRVPTTPNCVLSTATDETHRIAPFPFTGTAADALARVKAAALSFPRTKVVEEAPGYVHITFTSAVFRFVDDVELEVDEAAKVVNVRSASRVGRSDFGVNRKRVEAIREARG